MTKRPMIDPGHGGRAIAEWVGKTPNDAVPERVGLRIWRRQNGICGLSGQKINPGDKKELHHIIGLAESGEHRESNLIWVLSSAHKEETAKQAATRAKSDRIAKKHVGITQPSGQLQSRGFARPQPKQRSDRIGKVNKTELAPLVNNSPIARMFRGEI